MRSSVLVVAVSVLVVAACSDPGGGGGGGVVQDTIFQPTETVDGTGGGEVGDVTPDGVGCTNGTRQCSGQVAQQCVNGQFQDLFECPSTQVCEAGACKAGETTQPDTETIEPDPCAGKECGPDGEGGTCGSCGASESCNLQGQCVPNCVPACNGKECGSDGCGGSCGTCLLTEQCVQGACQPNQQCDCAGAVCGFDNCGNSCGTCPLNSTCSNGDCVPSASGGTCVDLIDCIYADGTGCADTSADDTAFQTCVDACYQTSSATGVSEFEAYLGCLQSCPQPDGDPGTTADDLAYDRCAYNDCSGVEAWCVLENAGAGTCIDIINCFDTCADADNDCAKGCYEASTEEAQAALWGLNGCLNVECPDPNDTTCVDEAFAGVCADWVTACQTN